MDTLDCTDAGKKFTIVSMQCPELRFVRIDSGS